MRNRFPLAVAALALSLAALPPARADEDTLGYTVEISDVTAKVGETKTLRATLRPRPGARMLHYYNNRVGQLSSFDDGVAFEGRTFPGVDQDGAMVFEIKLRPTKPGTHPINGIFRVGYLEGTDYMAMVSLPLIAKVIATE